LSNDTPSASQTEFDHLDVTRPFESGPFRELAHRVVDLLADHLERSGHREGPVLPPWTPAESLRRWPGDFGAEPAADPVELLARAIGDSNHLHHPRYIGHQCTSPLPWSALLDFAGALLNNGSAVYEMGPHSVAMERSTVGWFAGRIGYHPKTADGFFTHGGSAGNLTALLAARQHATPYDVWEEGVKETPRVCILASDQTHYSVRRSAQVMGLGGRSVIPIPTDARFRMRVGDLSRALVRARDEGRVVLAVVASAMSTATGAIDPLEEVAGLCAEHGVWLHVDAAHGGAMVFSERLRPRLAGMERADSIIIDAHKMLLMPALATLVIFKEGRRSFETFSQQASYLFAGQDPGESWYDLAQRTLECTKRSLGLQVYGSLQAMGTSYFARYVERMMDMGQAFARLVAARRHWELATEPDGNIVCFRYAPPSIPDPDAFQAQVREAIVKEGSYYLVKTVLRGKTYLRVTLINPRTELADLEALLARVEAAGSSA
jgi:L-2,4-diaminobutyrate decarboxylase